MLYQLWCCLTRRHDFRVVRIAKTPASPARLVLRCHRCGYETRGWIFEPKKTNA
jgi:hypothetical protein